VGEREKERKRERYVRCTFYFQVFWFSMELPRREKALTSGFSVNTAVSGGGIPKHIYPFLNDFMM
jgi:hypothetical protein